MASDSIIAPDFRVTGHRVRVLPVALCPAVSGWRLAGHCSGPSGHRTSRPGTLGCLQTRRNGLASGSVIAPALPVTGHRGRVPSVASRPAGTGWHLARSFLRTFGSPDMTAGYPRSPPAPPNRVGVWLGYQSSPSSHRTWRPGTLGCLQTRRVGLASGSDIPLVLQVTGHRGRVLPVALSPAGSGWRPARSLLGPSEHRTSRPGTLGCLQTQPDRVGIWLGHRPGPWVTEHGGRVPPVASCSTGSGWRPTRSFLRPFGHRTSRPGTPGCLLPRRIGLASGRLSPRPFGHRTWRPGTPGCQPASTYRSSRIGRPLTPDSGELDGTRDRELAAPTLEGKGSSRQTRGSLE